MKGFKDSTRMKYMCGGPVKKAMGGSVNDDPLQPVRPQTTVGGSNRGQRPPVPGPATVKPKSGAFAGLMQLKDKMKGASKQPNTGVDAMSKRKEAAEREARKELDIRTPVKKAMGGSVSPKPAPTKGTAKVGNPVTKGPPNLPKPAPTKGKPDMYTPQVHRDPTKLAPTKGPPNLPKPAPMSPGHYANGGSAKKGVPAHNSRPMIGRKAGGLSVMPKGKC